LRRALNKVDEKYPNTATRQIPQGNTKSLEKPQGKDGHEDVRIPAEKTFGSIGRKEEKLWCTRKREERKEKRGDECEGK
jgi:hypothetical protein